MVCLSKFAWCCFVPLWYFIHCSLSPTSQPQKHGQASGSVYFWNTLYSPTPDSIDGIKRRHEKSCLPSPDLESFSRAKSPWRAGLGDRGLFMALLGILRQRNMKLKFKGSLTTSLDNLVDLTRKGKNKKLSRRVLGLHTRRTYIESPATQWKNQIQQWRHIPGSNWSMSHMQEGRHWLIFSSYKRCVKCDYLSGGPDLSS